MSQPILTRKQYYDLNSKRFAKLTATEKKDRYNKYLASKQVAKDKKSQKARAALVQTRRDIPRRNAKPKFTKMRLSDCLLSYIKASTDPFLTLPVDPCIPDSIPVPSYKYNTTMMGTMIVGTSGVGVVLFDPITAAASGLGYSGSYSDFPLLLSTAAYDYTWVTTNPTDIPTKLVGVNSKFVF